MWSRCTKQTSPRTLALSVCFEFCSFDDAHDDDDDVVDVVVK